MPAVYACPQASNKGGVISEKKQIKELAKKIFRFDRVALKSYNGYIN